MNRVKKGLDNQAIGLLPLLLFMFWITIFLIYYLYNWGYFLFCLYFLFQVLSKDKVYQFMLLPSAGTLVLYSVFLCLKLEPVLFIYLSSYHGSITGRGVSDREGSRGGTVIQRIRNSKRPSFKRTLLRTTLNEFYFLAQLVQNLYTLHLFHHLVI